jgi:Uncharacterized alpha/beta hydrolase domain (DUF2235)
MKDGSQLLRDETTVRRIAKEAVKMIYQHVSSPRDTKYLPQRTVLAARFRNEYGSDSNGQPNVYPHFIGVFDTVASIANFGSLALVATLVLALILIVSGGLWFLVDDFWGSLAYSLAGALVIAVTAYVATHVKIAFGLDQYSWWQTLHLTEARMRFYDQQLHPNVGWARHALAIDEHRADFDRVPWGDPKITRETAPGEPDWLQQFWFAGDHSDIGGSYIENESRLSDISLHWMVEEAHGIPNGLKADPSVLQMYPSADGMQHDECKASIFRFSRKINRTIPHDACLHASVYKRFRLPAVLQYDVMLPYRPESLRWHDKVNQYY